MKKETTKKYVYKMSGPSVRRGFSILELVLAMFVLTIGIIGALGLIASTIKNSIDTRDSVIASGLVQEGVELVRNVRDNNMLLALSDLSLDREEQFTSHGISEASCLFDYTFDYNNATALSCNVADASLYKTPNGFYTYNSAGNEITRFKRHVTIVYDNTITDSTDPPPVGMTVTSVVWWDGENDAPADCSFNSRCIQIEDYLPKRD